MITLDATLSGRVLRNFAFQTGRPDDLALRDLLTGLMHVSRESGLDFSSELSVATENFSFESRGDSHAA